MTHYNPLLATDSYKASQFLQYPAGTEYVFSYIESRGLDKQSALRKSVEEVLGRDLTEEEFDEIRLMPRDLNYTTFFGLQAFLKKYLSTPFTQDDIDEAEKKWTAHGEPFNREGWEYVLKKHNGYMPVVIKAVPEGTNVPHLNVLTTVENTDPKCGFVTSYLETVLVRAAWYPTTVATISNYVRRVIYRYLEETCDDPDNNISFKLHDFGGRGVSSKESAQLGGMAHLVNFLGTDTMEAVEAMAEFYGEEMAGFSIPASEHSTMTSWGQENEYDAFENMLNQFLGEGKVVACVSDSYDIYEACDAWGTRFKERIEESGGVVVVRPDSGDVVQVVLEVIQRLEKHFGTTVNSKGYKVLPPYIRVIQGDGCTIKSIPKICENLKQHGYSIENTAFGMGGGLLQKLDRDTFKWAMKCSSIVVNGEERPVFKDPITDPGKVSKKGRLTLVKNLDTGEYKTVKAPLIHGHRCAAEQLRVVFRDGTLVKDYTLAEIRERAIEPLF